MGYCFIDRLLFTVLTFCDTRLSAHGFVAVLGELIDVVKSETVEVLHEMVGDAGAYGIEVAVAQDGEAFVEVIAKFEHLGEHGVGHDQRAPTGGDLRDHLIFVGERREATDRRLLLRQEDDVGVELGGRKKAVDLPVVHDIEVFVRDKTGEDQGFDGFGKVAIKGIDTVKDSVLGEDIFHEIEDGSHVASLFHKVGRLTG